MHRLRLFIPLLLVGCVSIWAPPAAEASFVAEAKDPAGDSTSSHPAHDLVAVAIAFNQKTGLMVGAVKLRGRPDEDGGAFVTIYAGMRSPDGCNGYPAGGFGAFTDSFEGYWVRQDGPGKVVQGEARKSGYRSDVQTFEVRSRKLAGHRWNCLGAVLNAPDDADVVYDTIESVPFRGLPELSVRTPRVSKAIPVGGARKLRVRIANPGDAALRNVRVRIGRARGVSSSPRTRMIRRLPARGHRVITVRVRPRAAAHTRVEHEITVRAGKLRATRELRYRVRHPKKKRGGGGDSSGGGVCVQYFPDLSGETGGSLGLFPC